MAAKTRFHLGLTQALRDAVRRDGISLDEEAAQHLLAGEKTLGAVPAERLVYLRDQVYGSRWLYMDEWAKAHPGENPFPGPFPERVLAIVHRIQEDPEQAGHWLSVLEQVCEAEMRPDNFTPDEEDRG